MALTLPATNAVSKRSFLASKRAKTYIRNATSSNSLNHLMILHVHQSMTDNMNPTE